MKVKKHLFSKSQWIGVGVLVVLIGAVAVSVHWVGARMERNRETCVNDELLQVDQTTAMVLDSIAAKEKAEKKAKREQWEEQRKKWDEEREQWDEAKKKRAEENHIEIHLQPFDPNTADSALLVSVGLRPWMAHNLIKYREKGGKYKKADDLKRLYGMADSLFATLEPYIQIAEIPNTKEQTEKKWTEKKDTMLELNSCDTTELMMIRGIGRHTAYQIVRYRQQLGGYCRVDQLKEASKYINDSIYLLLESHFRVCGDSIRGLKVNSASTEKLMRHPYLNYEKAKAIYLLRKKKGYLKGMDDLDGILTEEDKQLLSPYLLFSK